MKVLKYIVSLLVVSLMIVGCAKKESHSQTEISNDQMTSKNETTSKKSKHATDETTENNEEVEDKLSEENVSEDSVDEDDENDEEEQTRRSEIKREPEKKPDIYQTIDEFIKFEFESQSVNDDDSIKQDIIARLNEASVNAVNLSTSDLSAKYFMSHSHRLVNEFRVRVNHGYTIDPDTLALNNTKTEGVIQWVIKLKYNDKSIFLSGYRNENGQLPLTYCK